MRILRFFHIIILFVTADGLSAQDKIVSVPSSHLLDNVSLSGDKTDRIISSMKIKDPNFELMNSLKEKASKNKIARKIYEVVIIADSISNKNVSGKSEIEYSTNSGKVIRNIEIRRLAVFGSDIERPDLYNPYKSQKALNKTHISTIEYIIKNNLLFSSGDTVSPIQLSDNERLLRDLPFIDDARIIIEPVQGNQADITVITKDVYSIGGSFAPFGFTKGKITVFDNNILGLGNELGFEIPFDNSFSDSPGFGTHIQIDNPAKTFANLRLFYLDSPGEESYGMDIKRKFLTSTTKYSGGITLTRTNKNNALDTLRNPEPLRFLYQDFWLARSFLIDNENVTRLILSARFTNNNVFERPEIGPDLYHSFQSYKAYLTSISLSRQKYYKANLVYEYGRVEDIPYGGLMKVTFGREFNEFKIRNYFASELSFSKSFPEYGYLHLSSGLGAFINKNTTEQGTLAVKVKYFSNLIPIGRNMIRSFITLDYTRGFDRNLDEYIYFIKDNGFSGFRNDSVNGKQRMTVNLETVLFSPINIYGFRFAFFGFADISSLATTNQVLSNGTVLSGIGLGIRVRNDSLIFNTFQIRLGFFPNAPEYSRINNLTFSGRQPSKFENFDPEAPSMIPFR
ncbi:MAG TPA: hypothetical protein VHO50_12555 [Bacteroidales bacterium]|nr:hypothetical protein [Bacteroidales bacterium]